MPDRSPADTPADTAADTAAGPGDVTTLTVGAVETAQDRGVVDHPDPAGQPVGAAAATQAPDRTSARAGLTGVVANGATWSLVGKLGGQSIQFVAGLVLARLLAPADYGAMASVYVITGFAVLFFELGLGSALIALRAPTERDLSTVFWINALGGVAFTLVLAVSGPLVSLLFRDPRLTVLTPLSGLGFLFGVGAVHNALLQRQLKLKLVALIDVVSIAVSFAVTVAGAVGGLGVYALVLGPAAAAIVSSALSFALVPWRPHHFVSRASLPRIWQFSGGQLGFNVVNYWGRNGDNLLIARFVGQVPLGLYNKAYQLMLLPVQQVGQVLGGVMFPALSAMGGDHERVGRGYRRAVRLINLATVPVLVGLAAVAPGAVPLLWGDQWAGTVPLLMILCFAGIPQCVSTSVGWLFQSQNRTGLMFRVGLVSFVGGIALMVAGVLVGGATGVAVAVLVRAWTFMPPTLHVACNLVGLRARTVLVDNSRVALLCVPMFAAAWFTPVLLHADRTAAWVTLVQVAVGVLVYGALASAFVRTELAELFRVLRRRRSAA